ncbi:MerR family DNA-binding transcriptional regulator [Neomegalonema sp.]|uniref:MerR family transcriptional regulator n=1 Tax=Neomegalonema sp. TaxID=2039713 RepID=UPI002625043C|nr:MerR family DNA-binding transcriptional regulator [Neomegalonema sp.]MDD2870203.1 MerR family DNA-binding transcriptional regulator [Neomegalonema sp.]
MTEIFTITALCREFGVTPRTLRFYEAKGLLHPGREGERRRFTPRDRARLKLILRGKRFGFSLADIRELLDLYDHGQPENRLRQLSATLVKAEARIEMMRAQRDELTEAIDELEAQMKEVRRSISGG